MNACTNGDGHGSDKRHRTCDGEGTCGPSFPADDSRCGVIDCDGLDGTCRDYDDLNGSNAGRCEGSGDCKDPNTSDCTVFTDASSTVACGDCQWCDGSGACASACEADDSCILDKCVFVVPVNQDGGDCNDRCGADGASCVDVGSNANATDRIYYSLNPSTGCVQHTGVTCDSGYQDSSYDVCPAHKCRCERW